MLVKSVPVGTFVTFLGTTKYQDGGSTDFVYVKVRGSWSRAQRHVARLSEQLRGGVLRRLFQRDATGELLLLAAWTHWTSHL